MSLPDPLIAEPKEDYDEYEPGEDRLPISSDEDNFDDPDPVQYAYSWKTMRANSGDYNKGEPKLAKSPLPPPRLEAVPEISEHIPATDLDDYDDYDVENSVLTRNSFHTSGYFGFDMTSMPRFQSEEDLPQRAQQSFPELRGARFYEVRTDPYYFVLRCATKLLARTDPEASHQTREQAIYHYFREVFPDFKMSPSKDVWAVLNDKASPSPTHGPVRLDGLGMFQHPVYFYTPVVAYANGDSRLFPYFIAHKDESEAVLAFFRKVEEIFMFCENQTRYLNQYGGRALPIQQASWDSVFLEDHVFNDIKADIEFFLNSKEVFKKVGLHHKRGYLFCGPPGCGKTTLARVFATVLPFSVYSFDFGNPDFTNNALGDCFNQASSRKPSLVLLEDLDRAFAPDKGKTNITLDYLLNCLDGIAVNDGMVVVATANNPENLDPAILSRPGRFDKVIKIDLPSEKVRGRYLAYLFRYCPNITPENIAWVAAETEGLSMAFVKEVFMSAATKAMSERNEVGMTHVNYALDTVFEQFKGVARSGRRKAGFGV